MTSDNISTSERTLADVEREFGWPCWQDGDLLYARHPHTPTGDYDAQGDDPDDLREAILLTRENASTPRNPATPTPQQQGNTTMPAAPQHAPHTRQPQHDQSPA